MILLISSAHIYFILLLNALQAAFLLASRMQNIGIELHWIIPGISATPHRIFLSAHHNPLPVRNSTLALYSTCQA